MQSLKSVFGVLGALVPVVYCGGLIYYFIGNTGSIEDAQALGLGPTLLGLGVVGALFCIPLFVKILRLVFGLRAPASSARLRASASAKDGDDEFDPDATIARYMAQRSAEAASEPTTTPPSNNGNPPNRPTFGRRT